MTSRDTLKDKLVQTGCGFGCLSMIVAPFAISIMKGASDYVAKGPYSVSTTIRSVAENENLGRMKITYTRNSDNWGHQFDLIEKVSIQLESEGKFLLSVNKVKSTWSKGEDSLDELVPVFRQNITLSREGIKQPVTFDLREFRLKKGRSFFDVTRLNTEDPEAIQFGTALL